MTSDCTAGSSLFIRYSSRLRHESTVVGLRMKPRVSILNLLLLTTVVALVIVVYRSHRELREEHLLRIQLLQKGGMLQVTDPNLVHVVQVLSDGERRTLRWRVYVPEGRTVTLNTRLDAMPSDKPIAARLPPNAIVVADRAPANPLTLGPGEHVVTLVCSNEAPYLMMEVVSDGPRSVRVLCPPAGDLLWYRIGYHRNLTGSEHTPSTGAVLMNGRTAALTDGKTFVLCRFREPTPRGGLVNRHPTK
jgi:hypothetical protein